MRFSVGEMAIMAVAVGEISSGILGETVCVQWIGVMARDGSHVDYGCIGRTGKVGAMDWQLRKIDPPAEPVAMTHEALEGVEA
jgi:hypothetical protein